MSDAGIRDPECLSGNKSDFALEGGAERTSSVMMKISSGASERIDRVMMGAVGISGPVPL